MEGEVDGLKSRVGGVASVFDVFWMFFFFCFCVVVPLNQPPNKHPSPGLLVARHAFIGTASVGGEDALAGGYSEGASDVSSMGLGL